jgi:gamma-glutamyltranspeptidase/glutathione hydrolase
VSVTTTLNGWFGSGITVDNSGFLLNNEMDDFSIKPGHPNMYGIIGSEKNSIKPKKRMLSSMTPTIVTTNNNLPFLITGSPGGSTIITTVSQVISNVIDFKMEIKDAVESKRFHQQWFPDLIQIEKNSLNTEVINKLIDAEHNLIYRSDTGLGEANSIMIIDGVYYGASDSRRGAKAMAY